MLYLNKVINVKGLIIVGSKEVASIIKGIIDDYWAKDIDKYQATQKIEEIMRQRENRVKIIRGTEKTSVFIRIMGVRRLSTFDELYSN